MYTCSINLISMEQVLEREVERVTERENKILELVDQHKYLERSMIASQLFCFPSGQTKARHVLAKMHQRKLINRYQPGPRSEYIYFNDAKKSAKWRHWLDLNRFHFSLLSDLKQWQRVIYWDFEVRYPYGQADAFYILKLTLDGQGMMFFLEMDDGQNKFDKLQKYISYQKSKAWQREWWGQQGKFPRVVIVTPRVEEINELVKRCKGDIFTVISKNKEYTNILKRIMVNRGENIK